MIIQQPDFSVFSTLFVFLFFRIIKEKAMKTKLPFILCWMWAMVALAQPTPPPASVLHHGNEIRTQINANGALFTDFENGAHYAPFDWGATAVSSIRAAGIWIGGIDPGGNLKTTVQLKNENGVGDLSPGWVDWTGVLAGVYLDSIWTVRREDVLAHIADWEDDNQIDNPIPSIFAWPGRGNSFFPDYNGGAQLPPTVFSSAPFWDMNGDLIYSPDQGDFPILELRGCNDPVIPSENTWFVTNDFSEANTQSNGNPVGLLINHSVYSFNCVDDPALNQTVFSVQKIIHIGVETLDSAYYGFYTDFAVGCDEDDFIGTIPDRYTYYAYNADNDDDNCGSQTGYGSNPVAQSVDLLKGPIDIINGDPVFPPLISAVQITEAPQTSLDYYAYLSGSYPNGVPFPNDGFVYDGALDDPNAWSELADGNTPGPRQMIAAYGPFTLEPGAVNELVVAVTTHTGEDHLQNALSVTENVDQVQAFYDACFSEMECDFTVDRPRLFQQPIQVSVAPNPSSGALVIEVGQAEIKGVRILNTQGQLQFERTTTGSSFQADLQDLPTGFYWLQVLVDGQWVSRKWVKQ
jgi:hypothetical protein